MAGDDRYTRADFGAAALITIDVQRDVLAGGALEVAGTSDVLPAINGLAAAFRGAGLPIVHVVRLYRPDGDGADLARRAALEAGERYLIAGSDGAEPAPGLLPEPAPALQPDLLLAGRPQGVGSAEHVLFKPRWGAFFETDLQGHLRAAGVDTLVFAGCNFPNCPRTSIYEASERDFRAVVARDAISGLYERGEAELAGIGVACMSAEEIARQLG